MPRMHDASQWKGDSCERMDSQEYKDRSSLEHQSLRNEVQIPSLFQDHAVSWVRMVNDVDKYVTESMKRTSLLGNPLQKQDRDRRSQWRRLQFLFLLLEGSGSILKHNDHIIISVTKCQKPSPDSYDMINQSLKEATERSTTVTSLKSAGWRSSTVLRKGYLDIDSGKRRRSKENIFNIVWVQTLPIDSRTFEQFKFRRQCYWSYIVRQCTVTERIYRVTSTTSRTRMSWTP